MSTFFPHCLPLLIGSLPLTNHQEAVKIILRHSPAIPLWPQLPKCAREGMVRQFLSGFPGLVDEDKRFWIATDAADFATEMTSFYEDFIRAEAEPDFLATSRFALTSDSAGGFAALLDGIVRQDQPRVTLKGQVTGPVTTGIGARDSRGNAIFYDDNLRDMLIKHLAMKGRWQVQQLSRLSKGSKPIVFIDEPGMVSFGSTAFTGVSGEMASAAVGEVIDAIKQAGGLAGVHICANGDWGPVLDSATDILSFDAYSYFANISLYADALKAFLAGGGLLAWGIVPTGNPLSVTEEDSDSLFARWLKQVHSLSTLGISRETIFSQTFIAPACGTGSLPVDLAIKVLEMTTEVSLRCRQYGKRHLAPQ
ncbi:MAG: hypothetical protein ACK5PS_06975 [Desulfopila sp.]